jgi:hypothetical protein
MNTHVKAASVGTMFTAVIALAAAPGCGSDSPRQAEALATTSSPLTVASSGHLHPLGGNTDANICVGDGWNNGVYGLQLQTCPNSHNFTYTASNYALGYSFYNTCIDIQYAQPQNGIIDLATCNGTPAQQWAYTQGQFRSLLNYSYCLDVNGGNQNVGTRIDVAPCNGTAAQVFLPEGVTVAITSGVMGGSNPDLDVRGGDYPSTQPGATLDIDQTNGTAAQYYTFGFGNGVPGYQVTIQAYYGLCAAWEFGQNYNPAYLTTCGESGDNWFYSTSGQFQTNVLNNWCLDVNGDNPANGTPVDVTSCNGTPAQVWQIIWY